MRLILKSYTHDADFMAIVTASHLKDGQDAIIRVLTVLSITFWKLL